MVRSVESSPNVAVSGALPRSVGQSRFQASDSSLDLSQRGIGALDLLLRLRVQQGEPRLAVGFINRREHRVHKADLARGDVQARGTTLVVTPADTYRRQRYPHSPSMLDFWRVSWRRFLSRFLVVVGNAGRECFALTVASGNRLLVVHGHLWRSSANPPQRPASGQAQCGDLGAANIHCRSAQSMWGERSRWFSVGLCAATWAG